MRKGENLLLRYRNFDIYVQSMILNTVYLEWYKVLKVFCI